MAEEPARDTVAMQVRANLRGLTAPLKEQLGEIEARLVGLNRERSDLMDAKREIQKTIRWIEPSAAKANGGAGKLAQVGFDKKTAAVEKYIDSHRDELKGGTTGAELNRAMRKVKGAPLMSPGVTLRILRDLQERGIMRADKIVKGGAMLYVPVGRNK